MRLRRRRLAHLGRAHQRRAGLTPLPRPQTGQDPDIARLEPLLRFDMRRTVEPSFSVSSFMAKKLDNYALSRLLSEHAPEGVQQAPQQYGRDRPTAGGPGRCPSLEV